MTTDGRDSHEDEIEGDGSAVDFLLEWEEAGVTQCDDRLEPTREGGSYLTDAACEELSDRQVGFPFDPQRDGTPSWRRTGLADESGAAPVSAGRQAFQEAQPSRHDDREQAAIGAVETAAGKGPAESAPQVETPRQGSVAAEGAAAGQEQKAASTEEKQPSAGPESGRVSGTAEGDSTEAGKDGSEEFFQWTAERNKAIEEALSETREARLPTVHNQLDAIRRSLEKGEIGGDRALELLSEVERYLNDRIEHQKSKMTVAHEAVIGARSDLLKGLYSYQESVNSLKEYAASKEDVQLHLSVYTADQATSFIAQARHAIMEARPEEHEESRQ